ncbi:HtaA domain-containing protein [Citricoccus sp. NPDC055426]|uniref:HtaA domain-containing protein n=1 Tax=Citricoccus sp. NPDC055426 TaxID=3155536 RepID=UPI00343D8E65
MNAAQDGVSRRDTGMAWGIKTSFLAYVERWSEEDAVEMAPGTGRLADGRFYFTPDPERPAGALWFRGGVRLRAHGGMLDVSVSDPRVEERGSGHVLTAASWVEGEWTRIAFADLDWPDADADPAPEPGQGGAVRMLAAGARLHVEAVAVFDGTYPAGSELAPVQVRF